MKSPLTSLHLIRRSEWKLFTLLFTLISLVSVNCAMLRSMRNTIVVADGAAELMPVFELWVGLPAAFFVTWVISRLMRFTTPLRLFVLVVSAFLGAFVVFAYWVYPSFTHAPVSFRFLSILNGPKIVWLYWKPAIFFALAELWKVTVLTLLFWGFVNQRIPVEMGKRLYPPLLLGAGAGTLIAGPATLWCTSYRNADSWVGALQLLVAVIVAVGILVMALFALLTRMLGDSQRESESAKAGAHASVSASARTVFGSSYLITLALIVFADYVAYTMCEVLFLAKLKEYYPNPQDYCHHMGRIVFWSGILMVFCSLVLAPWLMRRYSWKAVGLGTPVAFGITTLLFFSVAYWGLGPAAEAILPRFTTLQIAVAIGSVQYCIQRATKYALFDSSKELAYVPLPREQQVLGKLAIDGIGGRFSRATSSVLNMSLFASLGGVSGAAPVIAVFSMGFTVLWLGSVLKLSPKFEALAKGHE